MTKICTKCKEEKPLTDFNKQAGRKHGVRSDCRECHNAPYRKKPKVVDRIGHKTCTTCKEEKPLSDFTKHKTSKHGVSSRCKACDKVYTSEWRNNNKEYPVKHYHASQKHSAIFSLRVGLSSLIVAALRNKRYSPFKRTALVLGCNCDDFFAYIESKFAEGMTWENRGEWEIDHIIPQSYAKTEEDVYILNHYTNLQPLWKSHNIEKGKSVPDDVAEKFLELKERNIFMKHLLKY